MPITQIVPASGDWFAIEAVRVDGPPKTVVTLSRVCVWALVDYEELQSEVQGLNSTGCPVLDEDIHRSYVYGDDLAPNGKTWKEIFNHLPSDRWNRKDLSAMPGFDPFQW